MSWTPPTLKDELGRARAQALRAVTAAAATAVLEDALPENPAATCDCGRVTTADMLVDVRGLSAQRKRALGLKDFACDACRERIFESGRISRDAFYEALGAPAATVTRIKAYATRRDAWRARVVRSAPER